MPHLNISKSELGGHTSTFFHVSTQNKNEWINGIFHNSPYGIFCLRDGKLELISKHYLMPKFRKCNCKDLITADEKIQAWLNKFEGVS